MKDEEEDSPPEGPPPLWEWLVGLVGLLLVVAALGYLALQALGDDHGLPDPVVTAASVRARAGGGFAVVVRVHNRSKRAAAGLRVEGSLMDGGQAVEQAEFELPYLPGQSTREGGLFFTRDPRSLRLELRATGYEKP